MLPDPNHSQAPAAECTCNQVVPGPIRGELLPPECGVVLRLGRVFRASMPKAAIDEHREFVFRENEVRLSGEFESAPPAGDVMLPEDLNQPKFRITVARAANPRHHDRALRLREDVRHGKR